MIDTIFLTRISPGPIFIISCLIAIAATVYAISALLSIPQSRSITSKGIAAIIISSFAFVTYFYAFFIWLFNLNVHDKLLL